MQERIKRRMTAAAALDRSTGEVAATRGAKKKPELTGQQQQRQPKSALLESASAGSISVSKRQVGFSQETKVNDGPSIIISLIVKFVNGGAKTIHWVYDYLVTANIDLSINKDAIFKKLEDIMKKLSGGQNVKLFGWLLEPKHLSDLRLLITYLTQAAARDKCCTVTVMNDANDIIVIDELTNEDTVEVIKYYIQREKDDYPFENQSLYLGEQELEDDEELEDDVELGSSINGKTINGKTLILKKAKKQLLVKISDKGKVVDEVGAGGWNNNNTIMDVKKELETWGYPSEGRHLWFNGKMVTDADTLGKIEPTKNEMVLVLAAG
jgi:hypothetical protein